MGSTAVIEILEQATRQTEIVTVPSFFSRLESIADPTSLDSPITAVLFPASDVVAFTLHYGIEDKTTHSILEGNSYPKIIELGLIKRLRYWVEGFRDKQTYTSFPIHVPVCELHAPYVRGTHATYTFRESRQKEGEISITVAGIGGGASLSRTLSTEQHIPVEPGECKGLVCDGSVTISSRTNPKTRQCIFLVDDISIDCSQPYPVGLDSYPAEPSAPHVCSLDDAFAIVEQRTKTMSLGVDYHTVAPESPYTTSITVEKDRKYQASFSVELPEAEGRKIGFQVSSHFSESVTAAFDLVADYQYIAFFQGAGLLPIMWAAKAFNSDPRQRAETSQ